MKIKVVDKSETFKAIWYFGQIPFEPLFIMSWDWIVEEEV